MWTHKTKTMCITPQEVNNETRQDPKRKKKWINDFTELGKRRNSAIVREREGTNKGGLVWDEAMTMEALRRR